MMEEVEAGRVEAIVIKDMSRLGRDYLKVGQVMEVLRQRGVRLIAINDGVDSLKGDDDFTPFRNIMNEFYARDTSRKIRSVFKAKGMSGKHLTGTVIYGTLSKRVQCSRNSYSFESAFSFGTRRDNYPYRPHERRTNTLATHRKYVSDRLIKRLWLSFVRQISQKLIYHA